MGSKRMALLKKFIVEHKAIKQQSATFIVTLYKYLTNNLDTIEIRSEQFIFNKLFYRRFVEEVGMNIDNTKSESLYYKNFKRLKRHGLVHKLSSDYPKGKTLVSINPNDTSLVNADFNKMDHFIESRQYVIDKMQESDMRYLYIYLRFFHMDPMREAVLSKLTWSDVIIINKINTVILHTTKTTFISDESSVYRLITLDECASRQIMSIKKSQGFKTEKIFDDTVKYEKFAKKFQTEYLDGMKINSINSLSKSYYILQTSPLEATLNTHTLQSVEVTLSEIEALFPGVVPDYLMNKEHKRIDTTFNKKKDFEDIDTGFDSHTDILDMEALVTLLRFKNKLTKALVREAIDELEAYKKVHNSKHALLIYDYIIYFLHRLRSGGPDRIKHKTFKNNIWVLNNYIFRAIENLEDIKDHEILLVNMRLENLKLNSQKTTIGILRRFFQYHELNSAFKVDVDMVYYPKSMIFDFEIDQILNEIEEQYKHKNDLSRIGKNHRYSILAQQVIILFGYYFGLRRNEIRSRRKKDFQHFHSNNEAYYIDVNKHGFKKLPGLSLKTSSATRRIKTVISNEHHRKIIDSFMEYCEKFDDNSLLLRSTTKENRIASAAVNENVFSILNEIIKKITKRYCTLHSLRHSFVTYRMMEIIEKKQKKPYEFFDKLNVPAGHSLPEATINSYVHWGLIPFLAFEKKDTTTTN